MIAQSKIAASSTSNDHSRALLDIVAKVAAELHPRRSPVEVTLDSRLDRELGFDSLGRVELVARLERAFQVTLPERLLLSVETPRDLLRALPAAHPTLPLNVQEVPAMPAGVGAAPSATGTLPAALDWHVQGHPDRPHLYLLEESGEEQTLSYGDLERGALAVAAGLQERNLRPGQTVAIMLPTSCDYFFSFFGVLRAGGIPVPVYPPARVSQIEEHLRRHARILANAQATILITVPEAKPLAQLLRLQVEGLHSVTTVAELTAIGAKVKPLAGIQPQDIAMLQYTSGSTGNPKGVVLTHANLLANIRAMGQAIQAGAEDVFVSWMPLYHDMGLIGAWLGSLYYGIPLVVMSPLTFLVRPERWLWAIHRHRATLSGSPNFGYELCLRRIADEDIEGLDLSSWRLAFNGAEKVSADTITRFQERFVRYGFRPQTMAPVYGLAESAVGLAFPPLGRTPVIDRVDRAALIDKGHAKPAAPDDRKALCFVACGQPLPGHQIRIVDDTGHEVGDREEGRLEFRGPSTTSGYFRNPEQTQRLFHDGWLDSGDLAYTVAGEVYLTGRMKDIIIRAGRNLHPDELEEAIGNLAGVRKGCVAVFGGSDPASGTETLVVLAETRATDSATHEPLRAAIGALTMDLTGVAPDDIVLAPPHTVLKTSSGKIRRAASRELYERDQIGAPTRALWRQVLHLLWAGLRPVVRRSARTVGTQLYAIYVWLLFWIVAPAVWLLCALLPRPSWAWAVSHAAARTVARLSAMPLSVQGLDLLPSGPCVLVANHASYLDGIVLAAALPHPVVFVVKGELQSQFVPRVYLQRLGAVFVERFDPGRGSADARRLAELARSGGRLAFFPEGTFERMPGLAPFHMGAFVAAAEAGVPVVPLSIRGTRGILRPDHWFPRRGAILVTVGKPQQPQGSDWAAALALRDAARDEILRHCGEPDLSHLPSP